MPSFLSVGSTPLAASLFTNRTEFVGDVANEIFFLQSFLMLKNKKFTMLQKLPPLFVRRSTSLRRERNVRVNSVKIIEENRLKLAKQGKRIIGEAK